MKAPDHMVSKREAEFEHPAKGPHHCSQCKYWWGARMETCMVVRGAVVGGDWCKFWDQK